MSATPAPAAVAAPAPAVKHQAAGHATGRPAWSSAAATTTTAPAPPPGQAKDPGTPASPHDDRPPPPGQANGHATQ